MKSTLSPERLAQLDFLIDSLDDLYVQSFPDDLDPFLMGKLSEAHGILHFVRDRASRSQRVQVVQS